MSLIVVALSINQSIINPYVAWLLQGWNCYIMQFDNLEERSDDEIWIRLAVLPFGIIKAVYMYVHVIT